MAARGIRMYPARKQHLVDPAFFVRQEQRVPFGQLMDMAQDGRDYSAMKQAMPGADPEEVRLRGIKAVEAVHADGTLSYIDRNTPEHVLKITRWDPYFARKVKECVQHPQMRSFLHPVKYEALQRGVEGHGN